MPARVRGRRLEANVSASTELAVVPEFDPAQQSLPPKLLHCKKNSDCCKGGNFMATIDTLPDRASARLPSPAQPTWLRSNWGVLLAVAALVAVLLLPTPEGLSVAGQRMLAMLAFAVIVWMTEALDYAVSAVVIAALMAFLLGLLAEPRQSQGAAGHQRRSRHWPSAALPIPRSRWSPRRCFSPAAMTATGLDKRIALVDPVARRHRDPPRGHRLDPGRLRDRLPGALDDGARRLPGADHARHHRGLRRQQEERVRRHADDHHDADRQHLERRHQDRRRAEHGGDRFHREDAAEDHHLARMADRRGAVRHPDVDRALLRDDDG